eukprot:6843136-Lingulodinium_polyedra.AAC.1
MRRRGWDWSPMPSQRRARQALLPYYTDGRDQAKRWYSCGTTVPRPHLHCLLRAEGLAAVGITF